MQANDKSVTIRQPSVANLMIDSSDRAKGSCWEFVISKPQNIANGFFTRIGATEVVLEWTVPNVPTIDGANQTITFNFTAPVASYTVSFTPGFYTVADVLDYCVAKLNSLTSAGAFVIQNVNGVPAIVSTVNLIFDVVTGTGRLYEQMNFSTPPGVSYVAPFNPDLRPYRYIDFLAPDLTYNQRVKDATTALTDQNVLVRWYFDYDNPVASDTYGFPIFMGYEPFRTRRLYNPPKQISWSSEMPIGNLGFRVIGTYSLPGLINPTNVQEVVGSNFAPYDGNSIYGNASWMMTLQLSEN